MNTPDNVRYLASHEWVREEGGDIIVGITDYAQDQLGDVVFVELPNVGDTVTLGDAIAVIESVKTASDIYAPASGEVIAINDELDGAPDLINTSPYGDGWLFSIRPSDPQELNELLDAEGYQLAVEEEG
jgi:glycine cleavage system H protein